MNTFGYILVMSALLLGGYAFVGYPLLLAIIGRLRKAPPTSQLPDTWPMISFSLPVYNEEAQIRDVLESLLCVDYPADRRQIVVVSDASSDGTDDIVREFGDRGVEFLRLPRRSGKTAAENAAAPHLRGDIVINTDASIRIRPDAIKHLIAQFADPRVGVASGRDLSVSSVAGDANLGEAGYVGYEMTVRRLETRLGGIIGASGCLYAVRVHLHRQPLPEHLSRDFASALIAREHGYRAVSVDGAVCLVPRTNSLHREYGRKVRTISRGMETLMFKSHLLNPFRYGAFAWKLLSHKVCRWLTPIAGAVGTIGIAILSISEPWARLVFGSILLITLASIAGWRMPEGKAPRLLAILTGAAAVQIATVWSLVKALHGDKNAAWEPTRRTVAAPQQSA